MIIPGYNTVKKALDLLRGRGHLLKKVGLSVLGSQEYTLLQCHPSLCFSAWRIIRRMTAGPSVFWQLKTGYQIISF